VETAIWIIGIVFAFCAVVMAYGLATAEDTDEDI
jgi:hypothetical protein